MRHIGMALLSLWLMVGQAAAETFSGLARIVPEQSFARDEGPSGVVLSLRLSQGVPFRVFTLAQPKRLVIDFQEVDWHDLDPQVFLQTARLTDLRMGRFAPGWSRMVVGLSQPYQIETAVLEIDDATGVGDVKITLQDTDLNSFLSRSGVPDHPDWRLPQPRAIAAVPDRQDDAPLRVVVDPGHGGIDPGAEVGSVNEKSLMLIFARELREELLRSGHYEVVLTRDSDRFVSLERRIALAHEAGADLFLSLHADSLAEGQAHGAAVHVLSQAASDAASAKLAERHDRDDLLAGVDLTRTDDQVTGILLDLARQETRPRTQALAEALVRGMADAGGPMNRRPLRSGAFSVLKAADIPSVLIEIGFLTSPRDLENLQDAAWRQGMARGIRSGLDAWREADQARRRLVRQ